MNGYGIEIYTVYIYIYIYIYTVYVAHTFSASLDVSVSNNQQELRRFATTLSNRTVCISTRTATYCILLQCTQKKKISQG